MAGAALKEAAWNIRGDVVHFSLPDNPSHLLQAGIPLEVSGVETMALGASQVTTSGKAYATTHYSDGRPRLRGVTLDMSEDTQQPNAHRWHSTVRFQGAEYSLGSFSAAASAGLAWDAAALALVGTEAATNFPMGVCVHGAIALYGPSSKQLKLPGYTNEASLSQDFPRTLRATASAAPTTSVPGSSNCANILDMVPPSVAAQAQYHNNPDLALTVDSTLWLLGAAPELRAGAAGDAKRPQEAPRTPTYSASGGGRSPRTPHSARRRLASAAAALASPSHKPWTEGNNTEGGTATEGTASGPTRSRSGYRGVTYMPRQDRCWQARIFHSGKFVYLGVYREAEEAAAAYDEAARRLKGYSARLNFPGPGESGATPRKDAAPALEMPSTVSQSHGAAPMLRHSLQVTLPPGTWGTTGDATILGSLVHSVLPSTAPGQAAKTETRGWVPQAWFLVPPAAGGKRSREVPQHKSDAPAQLHALQTASPMRVRLGRGPQASASSAAPEASATQHRRVQRVPGTSVVQIPYSSPPVFVHTDGFYKYALPGSHSFDPLEVTSVGASYTHAPPPPFKVYPSNHDPGAWGDGHPAANRSTQFPGVCRGRPNSVSGDPQWYVAVERVGTTRWLGPFPSEAEAARGGDVARLVLEGHSAQTSFHWDKGLFFAPEVAAFASVTPVSHAADSIYAALGDLKSSLLQAARAAAAAEDSGGDVDSDQDGSSEGGALELSTPPKRRRRGGSVSMPTADGYRTVPLSSLTTSPHAMRQALSPGKAPGGKPKLSQAAGSSASGTLQLATQQFDDARLRALSAAAFLDSAQTGSSAPISDPTAAVPGLGEQWGQGTIKRV